MKDKDELAAMHGAVFLTNSKEQSIQTYELLSEMARQNSLQISRLGSVSFVIPHVLKKTTKAPEPVTNQQSANMATLSMENLVKIADWGELDILVATIDQLDDLLSRGSKQGAGKLNPKWLVMEDYELMFSNKDYTEELRLILRQFMGMTNSTIKEFNEKRRVPSFY